MRINGTELALIRGDSHNFTLSCYDEYEKIDLVDGDIVYFTIKTSTQTAKKELQKVVTTFIDGDAIIEINPEDTKSMRYGIYYYDLQLIRSDGHVTTILGPDKFHILGEVTYE